VLIAVFSLVFTMQRAQEEDQSQLRSDLTSVLRRLIVLNAEENRTQGDYSEMIALVGEARAIFPQLDSVPPVYYRGVAQAMRVTYYYSEALNFADKAARQAAEDGDILEEIYARRSKAAIYVDLKDSRGARSEYKLAVAISDRASRGPDHIAALETKATTLETWGNQETGFGDCARAATLLKSAVELARSNPVLRSRWLTRLETSRDSARKRCRTT
jgi:tetratricopeptide (TPR) repeat protein